MASKASRKTQFGLEATAGTAPSTNFRTWRGMVSFNAAPEVIQVEEEIGIVAPSERTVVPRSITNITLEDTPATYQQICYLLAGGIEDIVTGSADGAASSGYTYQYDFSDTAVRTTKTYTIEHGDYTAVSATEVEEANYCFPTTIRFGGSAGAIATMSADLVGREMVQNQSFTSSGASTPAVSEMRMSKSALSIGAAGTAFGSLSDISASVLSYQMEIVTGLQPKPAIDRIDYSIKYMTRPSYRLTIAFEHDGNLQTEKDKWLAPVTAGDEFRLTSIRKIRFDNTGPTYGTVGSGTLFSGTMGMRMDLVGFWESFEWGDQNGNSIASGVFVGAYGSTDSLMGQIIVANETAALFA